MQHPSLLKRVILFAIGSQFLRVTPPPYHSYSQVKHYHPINNHQREHRQLRQVFPVFYSQCIRTSLQYLLQRRNLQIIINTVLSTMTSLDKHGSNATCTFFLRLILINYERPMNKIHNKRPTPTPHNDPLITSSYIPNLHHALT